MKTNNNRLNINSKNPIRANAGDEIGLLISLVSNEQIGFKMLLQNVTEILTDDPSLLVDIVLLLTDPVRITESDAKPQDFTQALVALENTDDLTARTILIPAIQEAEIKARSVNRTVALAS